MRTGAKRWLIYESLMLEYTVATGVRLYHRSMQKFKVGDVLTAQKNEKGKHWLSYHTHEKGLEAFRTKRKYEPAPYFTARERKKKSFVEPERKFKSFENLPSRFECVYATFIPHSRFLSKGQLYVVEPIGATHVVDSRIIDKLARLPTRSRDYSDDSIEPEFEDTWEAENLYDDYWRGTEPTRGNLQNLEILMDSARIIEVVNETTQPIQQGDSFQISSTATQINAVIEIRGDSVSWGDNKQTLEDFISDTANIPGIKVGAVPENSYFMSVPVVLSSGFKGKIHTMKLPEPGNSDGDDSYYGSKIGLTPLGLGYPVNIRMSNGLMIDFMKAIRKGYVKKI